MKEITCRYKGRCPTCDDWCEVGKVVIFDEETKRIYHRQCDPRDDKSPKFGETPEQLAERLGFKHYE